MAYGLILVLESLYHISRDISSEIKNVMTQKVASSIRTGLNLCTKHNFRDFSVAKVFS